MIRHKKQFKRIVIAVSLAVLLTLALAATLLFFGAESYLKKQLPQWVSQGSDQLYRLSIDAVEIKFVPLSIYFSGVTLATDEEIAKKTEQDSPDKILYDFRSPKIQVNSIQLLSLLNKQVFHCKSLDVYQPELKLSGAEIFENDTTETYEKILVEMQPLFKNRIRKVAIDEINFVDANYQIYSPATAAPVSNANKVTVTIKKFETDSLLIFNPSRFFDSEDILMKLKGSRTNMADSLHVLTIDTLEYSLKTSDIFARGFHLFPIVENTKKNRYDVTVPRLHLKSKSLARFSVEGSMDVQLLIFENPQIKFYQKEHPDKLDIETLNEFDLYSLVENQFTDIEIDTFMLENANLEIYRQPDTVNFQQHFQSINISLFGFALDSTSSKNTDKLFHADELEMLVHGYYLRLEDNHHEFSADSMFVSTLSNTVGTENIRISPLKGRKKRRTTVNIQCKALQVENVDLKTLFHKRILPTRKIQITEPKVHLQYHTEIERVKEQMETGLLFELVSAYLKGVYAEVVEIETGALNIQNLLEKEEIGYFQTDFNFLLSGFALDDESMKRTNKFFYATNFDLKFTDYQMKLVDNLHKIDVERVSILSLDRKLQINNLRLTPTVADADKEMMKQFNRSELYNIFVPKITMQGINLRDAFFYNKLNMADFQIIRPEIYFENFGQLREEKEKTEKGEIYDLVFSYISDFNIKKMTVPNGKFTWVNHTKKGKTISFDNVFSATLQNFRLNEAELNKHRLLFSDQFSVSVENPVFALSDSVHVLRAAQIDLSTATSSVTIRNAYLSPENKSANFNLLPTTFQATIPLLHISKIDFQKAWFSKELMVGKLELNTSKFKVFSKKGQAKPLDLSKFKLPMPVFLSSLHIGEMSLLNAQVNTYSVNGKEQEEGSNFTIDLTLPTVSIKNNPENHADISTKNVRAKITNFSTRLGKNHKMEFEQLDFDRSKQSISISHVEVLSFAQNKLYNSFKISVPDVQFTGFELNQALEENRYLFNSITFDEPDIFIDIDLIKNAKTEFTKNLDIYPFIETYVDQVKVAHLQINKAQLHFNWLEKLAVDRQFNIHFKDINIAENRIPEQLFHAKEFEISTEGLSTKSKDGQYEFSAGSLVYNSRKHNALLEKIQITPLLGREAFQQKNRFQTDYLNGKAQFVELQGIDENLWLEQKILSANALVIGAGNLDIFRNKRLPFNENQRPPWPQDLLKEIDPSFAFDSVILKPTTIIYSELLEEHDKAGWISFEDLQLKTGQLTNIEERIAKNPHLKIDASTKLMGESLLSVEINFDLSAKNKAHTVVGNLQPLALNSFNPIIENSAPLSVETGSLNRFDFDFSANEKHAVGELYFGYDNLKIAVMDFGGEEARRMWLATLWANTMVVNSKNPKGDKLSPERIEYERDEQRSILNYWWKSIFTAAKQSIGIKADKE